MTSWLGVAAVYFAVYCGICWLVSGSVVLFGGRWWSCDDPCENTFARFAQEHPLRAKFGLLMAVLFLGPLLPAIALYCICHMLRDVAGLNRLRRSHREYVFQRMHPANLPRQAFRYVQQHTPALLELGFSKQGDYLLKGEPLEIYGSCLCSSRGESIAELLLILETTNFSFNTVFEDGAVLETSSTDEVPELEEFSQTGRFYCHFVPGCSPTAGYQRHLEKVAAIQRESGCRPLSFDPEQLQEVLTYASRTFGHVACELDSKHQMPPPAELPAGTPISAEELLDAQPLDVVSSG